MDNGCQQVLWLYGEDNQITEVGTMNLFLYWINEDGGNALRCQLLAYFFLPPVIFSGIGKIRTRTSEQGKE